MYLHEPSLNVYHEHLIPLGNKDEDITITVNRSSRFCPSCKGRGYKHENIFGSDCPLRGPCNSCRGTTKVQVPASSQFLKNQQQYSSSTSSVQRTMMMGNRTRSDESDPDGICEMISIKCRTCKGTGKKLTNDDVCERCKGYETVSSSDEYQIFIPKGTVVPGDVFEFEGEGNQQRRIETDERIQGNLYIYLDYKYDPPVSRNDPSFTKAQIHDRIQELLIKGEKLSSEPNTLYQAAIKAFGQVLELDRNNCNALAKRSGVHLLLKNYQQAANDADLAVTFNNMYFEGFAKLGDALRCLGRNQEAKEKYKKAKFLAPDKETEDQLTALIVSLEQPDSPGDNQGLMMGSGKDYSVPPYPHTLTSLQKIQEQTANKTYHPPTKTFTATFQNTTTNNNNTAPKSTGFPPTRDNERQNLFLTYHVTVPELNHGTTKTISVVRASHCPACCGSGSISSGGGGASSSDEKSKDKITAKPKTSNDGRASPVDEDDADKMMMMLSLSQEKGLVLDDGEEKKEEDETTDKIFSLVMNDDDNADDHDELKRRKEEDEKRKQIVSSLCPVCSGYGVTNETKKLDFTIPPLTPVGKLIYLENEGNQVKGIENKSRGLLTIKLAMKVAPAAHHHHNHQNRHFHRNAFGGRAYDDYSTDEDEEDLDEDDYEWSRNFNHHHQNNNAAGWGNNTVTHNNTRTAWLTDLAKKYGFELADSTVRLIVHSHQITDLNTFLLMEKSDVDGLGLPVGPKMAVNKILEKEKNK